MPERRSREDFGLNARILCLCQLELDYASGDLLSDGPDLPTDVLRVDTG